jgi:UDP-N-acetylmuramate dehydrogenase
MEIFSNHPLLKFNTFGVEAYAKEFIEIFTDGDLKYYLKNNLAGSNHVFILGGGSNILLTGDYSGTMLKMSTRGIEVIEEDDEYVRLRVAAGEDWDGLVEYCVGKGWGGLENLSGIPGQAGSSPIQNIGAYGSELKDHFDSLEAINLCTGEDVMFDAERCQFGYRDSIFKRALKGRVAITHVIFRLRKKPVFNLNYNALKQYFAASGKEITLPAIREAVLGIRAAKLPDPKVIGNAGSFFKNPVVDHSKMEELKELFPGIVYYEASGFKLAAGWLIEQCGWKGYREGDAGVHKDQSLVLVNYGKASGLDILSLAGKIQRSVKERFGIDLEREVNVI